LSYGLSPGALTSTVIDAAPKTEHELQVVGLSAGTRYYYAVGPELGTIAGGDSDHSFRTHPPTGVPAPVRIWAVGDSSTSIRTAGGDVIGEDVRDAWLTYASGHPADVWIMLGDNAYNFGTESEYTSMVFDRYREILRNTPLWPTLGAHDVNFGNSDTFTETGVYFDAFTLPPSGTNASYSFDYADVHFVSVNTAGWDLPALVSWLDADLQVRNAAWTIVYWYHTPYTKGSWNSDICCLTIVRQNLVPILEDNGVDLLMAAASHVYERSMLIDGHYGLSTEFDPQHHALDTGDGDPEGDGAYSKPTARIGPHEGTVYMTLGVSSFPKSGPLNHPIMVRSIGNVGGSVVIDIIGSTMDVSFIDTTGQVVDHFQITKGAPEPTPVPMLSRTGLALLGLLIAGSAVQGLRSRSARAGRR
jgi:hypothetical protein